MGIRRKLTGAVCALVLAGSTVVPARADTPPAIDWASPYTYGIMPQLPGPRPWQKQESEVRTTLSKRYAAGLRGVYIWVGWSDIEQSPGTYTFDQLDTFLRVARETGTRVSIQVMTGDWSAPQPQGVPLRTNPDHPGAPNVPGVDLGPALDFWIALVRHAMPGGELARAQGWTDGFGVREWEVENEPAGLAWWGTWGKVPKDYAAFLATIVPPLKALYPGILIAAPALAQTDGAPPSGGLDGIPFLDEVLSVPATSSLEWASSTYRDAPEHPAGGPFIGALSFHKDNVNVENGEVPSRARAVRDALLRHVDEPGYPTDPTTPIWFTEGGALSYNSDDVKLANAQCQLMGLLHGAGVQRMELEAGAAENDASWETNPVFLCSRAITTYFPTAGHVTEASADLGADAGKVVAFRRDDPVTGRRTWILWARDLPMGDTSGAQPPFTVRVPAVGEADVVDRSYVTSHVTGITDGIDVTLNRDDPSPVVFVAEGPPAGQDASAPMVPELPTSGAAVGVLLVLLLVLVAARARRGRWGR
jgi:hypothetical protein